MGRAEEKALEIYPDKIVNGILFDYKGPREFFINGYDQAGKDVIEYCEGKIAEYNANNFSNLFLRRAFEDVIRFIKEIPYKDYTDDEQ